MVTAGQDARTARRAQRRRVHVAVAQPVRRDRVEAGRVDRTAVTAQLTESRVVQHDEQHIRGTRARPHRLATPARTPQRSARSRQETQPPAGTRQLACRPLPPLAITSCWSVSCGTTPRPASPGGDELPSAGLDLVTGYWTRSSICRLNRINSCRAGRHGVAHYATSWLRSARAWRWPRRLRGPWRWRCRRLRRWRRRRSG